MISNTTRRMFLRIPRRLGAALVVGFAPWAFPAAAAEPASCYQVTRAAEAVFQKGLTGARRAAAKRIEARGEYCRQVVPDGTPGALDAMQAEGLRAEVAKYLDAEARAARGSVPGGKVAKAKRKLQERARRVRMAKPAALPRARPHTAPGAIAEPLPAPVPAALPLAAEPSPPEPLPVAELPSLVRAPASRGVPAGRCDAWSPRWRWLCAYW